MDDQVIIAMSSVEMLEDMGHTVGVAYSGSEALTLLQKEEPFDLLITDFAMPRMTGGQLSIAARQIFPNLLILLTTGYAEQPDDGGLALPCLSKPYSHDELQAAVERVLIGKAD